MFGVEAQGNHEFCIRALPIHRHDAQVGSHAEHCRGGGKNARTNGINALIMPSGDDFDSPGQAQLGGDGVGNLPDHSPRGRCCGEFLHIQSKPPYEIVGPALVINIKEQASVGQRIIDDRVGAQHEGDTRTPVQEFAGVFVHIRLIFFDPEQLGQGIVVSQSVAVDRKKVFVGDFCLETVKKFRASGVEVQQGVGKNFAAGADGHNRFAQRGNAESFDGIVPGAAGSFGDGGFDLAPDRRGAKLCPARLRRLDVILAVRDRKQIALFIEYARLAARCSDINSQQTHVSPAMDSME